MQLALGGVAFVSTLRVESFTGPYHITAEDDSADHFPRLMFHDLG
jgi:hypothetical protein